MSATTISKRFAVDGEQYSLADLLSANADDPEVCAWARSAQPGDRFPALVDCVCVAADLWAVSPEERAALQLGWDAHLLRMSLGLAPRSPHPDDAPRTKPRQFHVSATRPDGSTSTWAAMGGTSCDHIDAAADVAGLGGVVRVVPLDLAV